MGPVAEPGDEGGGQHGQPRRHQHRGLPAPAGVEKAHPVGQRGAEGEHADQPGQRRAGLLGTQLTTSFMPSG
jgi:hypothetical protein